jgi:general secretion pathway protein G
MLLRRELNPKHRAAFTLMEMLIVVAIIVALASIAGFALFTSYQGAQKDIARTKAKGILDACTAYAIKHGSFPDSLEQLLQKDDLGGPYLKSHDALKDPWGQQFQYRKTGSHTTTGEPEIYASHEGEEFGSWGTSK